MKLSNQKRHWPGYLFGRIRTSTLVLIAAFLAVWWIYETYRPQAPGPGDSPPTQVVPPGFVPDPDYTWVPRTRVQPPTVYLDANQRILAPRDSPITKVSDLSGKRVCVARGTTSLRRIREIAPPPVIVSVVNWADCLVALQQREIDAVSTDDTILAGLVEEDPYLHIVGPDMADQPYGVGINLDNTGLVRFVNGTLERIRNDGTWNTLYRKWLTVLGPAPAPPTPRYVD